MTELDDIAMRLQLASSSTVGAGARRALARELRLGALRRVRRGVYGQPVTAPPKSEPVARARFFRERYQERALAVSFTRRSFHIMSHHTAAALWDIPVADPWPREVHILVADSSRAETKRGVRVHRDRFDDGDYVRMGDLFVTTPARTIYDLARAGDVDGAVVALDFSRNPRRARPGLMVGADALEEQIERSPSARGIATARAVASFSIDNSGSVGESLSRIGLFRCGFPEPETQVWHSSKRVTHYETDFEWRLYGVIGEFDGRGKYLKESLPDGIDPGTAVYEEKLREDELRAEPNTVARWGWAELRDLPQLRDVLLKAGLPLVRKPSRGLGAWR